MAEDIPDPGEPAADEAAAQMGDPASSLKVKARVRKKLGSLPGHRFQLLVGFLHPVLQAMQVRRRVSRMKQGVLLQVKQLPCPKVMKGFESLLM